MCGMGGPVDTLKPSPGKAFASLYARYGGLALVAVIGLLLTSVIHRFFHEFRIEDEQQIESRTPAMGPPSNIFGRISVRGGTRRGHSLVDVA